MKKIKNHDISLLVYLFFYILIVGILLLCILISHGNILSNWFFSDTRDTGMDFFHSIEYVNGRTPYSTFQTLYPPLANLFFLFICHCVPLDVSRNWPLDFEESVAMRGSEFDLRTYQAPMVLFLAFICIALILTLSVCFFALRKRYNTESAFVLSIALTLNWGFIVGIERGNIILLIPALCIFFLLFYDSKNGVLRELSLISLAIAAGFKLYPAFLGIMLLRERNKQRWGMAIRAVIYGILAIILPCFVFREGLNAIPIWLKAVSDFQSSTSTTAWAGLGMSNILSGINEIFSCLLHTELSTGWVSIVKNLIVILLLINALVQSKRWISILSCTLAMILFQSQSIYILCLYLLPIIFYFIDETKVSKDTVILFGTMMLLLIPTVLPNDFIIQDGRYIFIQALMIIQIVEIIRHSVKRYMVIKHSQTMQQE